MPEWSHPGGKLRELGPESLTDAELLSIIISSGIKGKPAEKIAEEILERFNSFKGIANQPLEKFLEITRAFRSLCSGIESDIVSASSNFFFNLFFSDRAVN